LTNFDQGALNTGTAPPAESTESGGGTLQDYFTRAEAQTDTEAQTPSDPSLNPVAATEGQQPATPTEPAEPVAPERAPVPYERVQALTAQNRAFEERARAAEEQSTIYREAAELMVTPQQYQALTAEATQYGFPDTKSYVEYAKEYNRQEAVLNQAKQDPSTTAEYLTLLEQSIRNNQEAARQNAVTGARLMRQESQEREGAINYARDKFGVTELGPELNDIFAKSDPATLRILVDKFEPIMQARLNSAKAEWMAADATRRQTHVPVSANAGGSPAATAGFDPKNPPSLASLFKI
jgi:hypothetical protein